MTFLCGTNVLNLGVCGTEGDPLKVFNQKSLIFLALILTLTGLTKCDFQTTSLIFITEWKPPEYRSYQCTYRHCGIFSRSS